MMDETLKNPSRRATLRLAALGAAGLMAEKAAAQASASPPSDGVIRLKFQSSIPEADMLSKFGNDFADRVNAMGKGRVVVEMLPVGTVAKPNELLKAASDGLIDGGLGYPAYWYGQNKSVGLWDAGPAFGMDSRSLLGWHEFGGGKALLDEIYRSMDAKVVSIPCIALPTQPLGWFKKPIRSLEDLKGLKYRTVGLALEVYKELGMDPTPLPGAVIIKAMKDGTLDGAEWNNVTSDRTLGLPSVAQYCMLQSFHEATAVLEVLISKDRWDAMPADVRAIIRAATKAMSTHAYQVIVNRNATDMAELASTGTTFLQTPNNILTAELQAWDRVLRRFAAQDVLFDRVVKSQREYAARMSRWRFETEVDYSMAYGHFFNRHKVAHSGAH